ncbi:MAG: hypothetical protein JWM89_1318 [Acidimicrobiales bacterium]|nr:hypothetical protein [Acidimicrobiales bacterium]
MAPSRAVEKIVISEAAGLCSMAGCGVPLVVVRGSEKTFIGEVAHIVSGRPTGPRFSTDYPSALVDHESNLLALCPNHHSEIDKLASAWTVTQLREMKAALYHRTGRVPAQVRPLSGALIATYVNLPRLTALAVSHGKGALLPTEAPSLARGEVLIGYLAKVEEALSEMSLDVLTLTKSMPFSHVPDGVLTSFRRGVRAANVAPHASAASGPLSQRPQVYIQRDKYRITMPLDVRFICSQTLMGDLGTGAATLAGVFLVKHRLTAEERRAEGLGLRGHLLATPLVLGSPYGPMDRRHVAEPSEPSGWEGLAAAQLDDR